MMKRNKRSFTHILALALLMLPLTGCSSRLTVGARADLGCDVTLSLSLGDSLVGIIKSITMVMDGSPAGAQIFSAPQIEEALLQNGISARSVKTSGEGNLFAEGTVPKETMRTQGFSTCTDHSLSITLSPENMSQIALSLPQESQNFLELLMAPALTGEELGAEEYRDLIGAIYGEEIVSELDSSIIEIRLLPPKGKKIKSGEGTFTLPLVDFLVMQEERSMQIEF